MHPTIKNRIFILKKKINKKKTTPKKKKKKTTILFEVLCKKPHGMIVKICEILKIFESGELAL